MPVYIYEPDAFEKMVEVEGEEYRRFRSKEEFDNCSFEAFLEKWKEIYEENEYLRNYRPEAAIDVESNGAIYGLGGFNRYIVLNSGEITFLEPASTPKYIERAKNTGFRMFVETKKNKSN